MLSVVDMKKEGDAIYADAVELADLALERTGTDCSELLKELSMHLMNVLAGYAEQFAELERVEQQTRELRGEPAQPFKYQGNV